MSKDKCPWWGYCIIIVLIILAIAGSYYRGVKDGYYKRGKEINPPTPVEKEIIDTLYITRDNIITRVKYLDSIKYDTIEKIYVLNDTASVELFYKLVSE